MSRINASFDTTKKSGSLTLDGAEMSNAQRVYFEKYDEEWHCSIEMMDYDKDNDVRTYHRLMSKLHPKFEETAQAGQIVEEKDGFAKIKTLTNDSVKQSIASFIEKINSQGK